MIRRLAVFGLVLSILAIGLLIMDNARTLRALNEAAKRPPSETNAGVALDDSDPRPGRSRNGNWRETARRHGWELDYETAKKAARRANQPLMVVLRCVP